MISREKVAEIHRLFYVEHMSINAVSEHLEVHRDTVERALSTEKFCNKRFRVSILDPYERYIAETVEQYPKIRAPRLTQLLKDRGYKGSPSSVRRYLRQYRSRQYQAYQKLEFFPGEQAQVDWADFGKIIVDGGFRRLSCFVMVLSHSRAIYARFAYDQTLESFLFSHVAAFLHFNSIPRTILYDNLKSAVLERHAQHIKYNQHLIELSIHYRFGIKACQPYSGNQKGRVERAIRYIRENFFEARKYQDITDLNRQLLDWINEVASNRPWPQNKEKTVQEAFEGEQAAMIPLPNHHPELSRLVIVRAKKIPYIHFDGNQYSIPHQHLSIPLSLRAYPEILKIYDQDKLIATHQRTWSKGKTISDPEHITSLVEHQKTHRNRKNRSILLTRLPAADGLIPKWIEQGINIGANAMRLLSLLEEYSDRDVQNAIEIALQRGTSCVESIRFILKQSQVKPVIRTKIKLPEKLQGLEITSHDPSQYDLLSNIKETENDRHGTTESRTT